MVTFVLVHGAWHGGWCWRRTARLLRDAGHEVYTPTLSGLADRSHLLGPQISIQTHIDDVANLILWEDLSDVRLVGHSYAGSVIAGVADAIPDRLGVVIALDAIMPGYTDPLPPLPPEQLSDLGIAPPAAAFFGLPEALCAAVDRRLTPQPLRCRTEPYTPRGGLETTPRRAYLAAPAWAGGGRTALTMERLAATGLWETYPTDWGHDMMVDRPDELAAFLMRFA